LFSAPAKDRQRSSVWTPSTAFRKFEWLWGVHPIAHGRDFGFIHPVMKSRRVSQIEMGHRRRFKTLSDEN
jgi:hypothetical protein